MVSSRDTVDTILSCAGPSAAQSGAEGAGLRSGSWGQGTWRPGGQSPGDRPRDLLQTKLCLTWEHWGLLLCPPSSSRAPGAPQLSWKPQGPRTDPASSTARVLVEDDEIMQGFIRAFRPLHKRLWYLLDLRKTEGELRPGHAQPRLEKKLPLSQPEPSAGSVVLRSLLAGPSLVLPQPPGVQSHSEVGSHPLPPSFHSPL